MSLAVNKSDFHLLEGELASGLVTAESGRPKEFAFCPQCGSRIYHTMSVSGLMSLKPGSLDDTSWLEPVGHLWTKSKQPWVTIPDGSLAYEEQPENFDTLFSAWENQRHR